MQITKSASATLAIALFLTVVLPAQEQKPLISAPIPPQIVSAKRVFISNAGTTLASLYAFKQLGGADRPYNQFYQAMKTWGRYELAPSPAEADLVFEIRFTDPYANDGRGPLFQLSILDTKTHFTLWAISEPIQSAAFKSNFEKNFNQGMDRFMDDIKKLSSPSVGQ